MLLALMLQNDLSQEQIQKLVIAMMAFIPILILIGIAIFIVPCWFICKKAGFSPWLSLLCVIPTVGILVLLYVLAFADWKVAPTIPQAWSPQQPPYPPQQPPYPPQPPYQPKA